LGQCQRRPYFFKDGKRFLWSSERTGYRHLYLYDLDGKLLGQITKGEWEVTSLNAVEESKGLAYFTATEKSPLERHLYRVGVDGSGSHASPRKKARIDGVLAPNAATFYDTHSNTAAPSRRTSIARMAHALR